MDSCRLSSLGYMIGPFSEIFEDKKILFLLLNRNISKTALCTWIGWVVFEREFKYLYFINIKYFSGYHGYFVINKNINIENWKKMSLASNPCGSKNWLNRFKIPRRGAVWIVFGRVIWAKWLVHKFQRFLRLKYF